MNAFPPVAPSALPVWLSMERTPATEQLCSLSNPAQPPAVSEHTLERMRERRQENTMAGAAEKVTVLRNQTVLFAGMTEAQVIAKAQLGDERCFEALYTQHKRRVYSLCLRMTGNQNQAEDFTQEAFLQLFRKIGSFRGESAFSTWLHRLSVNIVLMQFRKKGLAEISLDETLDIPDEDNRRREIATRDNVLHGSIDRITLQRAIGDLAPGYRIIFVLHDVEGYEHNEIAEMLGCSIGNSKSQLHKARMKLRTFLASHTRQSAKAVVQVARAMAPPKALSVRTYEGKPHKEPKATRSPLLVMKCQVQGRAACS
jgi:RNA polymerase sigma-70 factor (ECF subfamily)